MPGSTCNIRWCKSAQSLFDYHGDVPLFGSKVEIVQGFKRYFKSKFGCRTVFVDRVKEVSPCQQNRTNIHNRIVPDSPEQESEPTKKQKLNVDFLDDPGAPYRPGNFRGALNIDPVPFPGYGDLYDPKLELENEPEGNLIPRGARPQFDDQGSTAPGLHSRGIRDQIAAWPVNQGTTCDLDRACRQWENLQQLHKHGRCRLNVREPTEGILLTKVFYHGAGILSEI